MANYNHSDDDFEKILFFMILENIIYDHSKPPAS